MPRNKALAKKDSATAGRVRKANGQLVGGNPGNKGGKGAQPKSYRLWLKHLLDSQKHRDTFTAAMEDSTHPAFMAATKHASEFGYGKPAQRVEVEDVTPTKDITIEAALAKVSEMARAAKALGLRAPLALPPIPEAEVEEID